MEQFEFRVDEANKRVDQFISDRIDRISRSRAAQMIRDGNVKVDGENVKPSLKLKVDQKIVVISAQSRETGVVAQDIPVDIIFEDDDVIVVDKPVGMPVHAGPGHPDGTLVNALLSLCPDLKNVGDTIRPGIVHRLDIDTSGVMVVAKSGLALQAISDQFKRREVKKTYTALVKGSVDVPEAIIDAPIGRDPDNRKKMSIVSSGRESITRYKTKMRFRAFDLLQVTPLSGRTHQIRVHLSSIGHPIAGDDLYGGNTGGLCRPFLHASSLTFKHPISHGTMEFKSELHQDLKIFLKQLR